MQRYRNFQISANFLKLIFTFSLFFYPICQIGVPNSAVYYKKDTALIRYQFKKKRFLWLAAQRLAPSTRANASPIEGEAYASEALRAHYYTTIACTPSNSGTLEDASRPWFRMSNDDCTCRARF